MQELQTKRHVQAQNSTLFCRVGVPVYVQPPVPVSHPHRGLGLVLLIAGIVLLIGGIAAAAYCSASFFGVCLYNPYAGIGWASILVGLLLLVVGVVLALIPGAASAPTPPTVVYGQQPNPYAQAAPMYVQRPPQYGQPYPMVVPPPPGYGAPLSPPPVRASERFCPACGTGNMRSAGFCVGCGKALPPFPG